MLKGRIVKGIGGFYYVDIEGKIFECRARGIFRKDKITPLVGDFVKISILDGEENIGVIEEILPRKSKLIRPSVANVDQAIIVFSILQPEINLLLLDKFLVLAERENLDISICLNKIDLAKDESGYEEIVANYKNSGYKLLLTSYKYPESMRQLEAVLKGKVNVFAGPSGVGKSSLLNKINPDLQLKTGEVSKRTLRGKHTTRHVELLPIGENSWVVDTPGFSTLNIDFIPEEELANFFPEFKVFYEDCTFSTCRHIDEPKCGIKQALDMGYLAKSRYKSYLQLVEEIRKNRRF